MYIELQKYPTEFFYKGKNKVGLLTFGTSKLIKIQQSRLSGIKIDNWINKTIIYSTETTVHVKH